MKIIIAILFILPFFAKAQVPTLNLDTTYAAKANKTGVLVVTDAAYFTKLANADTLVFAQFDIFGKLTFRRVASVDTQFIRRDINLNTTAITTKLNITDTANIRLRAIAGTNTTITGTYPNLTFNSATGGTGTVTNVGTGLGLLGGPITTTGTLIVDTSSASILSRQRAANTYATIASNGSKADTSALLKIALTGLRNNDLLKYDSINNTFINFRLNYNSPLAWNYATNTASADTTTAITGLATKAFVLNNSGSGGGGAAPFGVDSSVQFKSGTSLLSTPNFIYSISKGLRLVSKLDTLQNEDAIQIMPSDSLSAFGISFKQKNIVSPQKYRIGVLNTGDFIISNITNPIAGINSIKLKKDGSLISLSGDLQGNGTGNTPYAIGNNGGVGASVWLGQTTPSSSNFSLFSAGFSILNAPGGDIYFRTSNTDRAHLFNSTGNFRVGVNPGTDNGSTLQAGGSFSTSYVSKSASYTATPSDCIIEVTATGQTITLPTSTSIAGRYYTIKLTATGTCTVNTTSSQTIDGATTYSLSAQYKYVTIQSNGANWIIISNN